MSSKITSPTPPWQDVDLRDVAELIPTRAHESLAVGVTTFVLHTALTDAKITDSKLFCGVSLVRILGPVGGVYFDSSVVVVCTLRPSTLG